MMDFHIKEGVEVIEASTITLADTQKLESYRIFWLFYAKSEGEGGQRLLRFWDSLH